MQLKSDLRSGIVKDWETANFCINNIYKRPETNFTIYEADYLTPRLTENAVDLQHPSGRLRYYQRISKALESAIETGIIPSEMIFEGLKRAPLDILGLFPIEL